MSECYQCGRCGGICPVARVKLKHSPRRILSKIPKDLDESYTDELWLCTTCFSCNEVCREGIDLIDIFVDVRNYAAQSGHVPENLREMVGLILKEGVSSPITPDVLELRRAVGLKDIKRPEGLSKIVER